MTDKQRAAVLRRAVAHLKKTERGYVSSGTHWRPAMADLERVIADLDPPPPKVPQLGAVFNGGVSVLAHDLTHPTAGIPLFPAFDDAFRTGTPIIAPEPLTVSRRPTSSNPGRAFYALGQSGLEYWFGHLDRNHPVGKKFAAGAVIGLVAPNTVGGGPHVHVGVNAERLLGKGLELKHRTDYRHGAPTIGAQLREIA